MLRLWMTVLITLVGLQVFAAPAAPVKKPKTAVTVDQAPERPASPVSPMQTEGAVLPNETPPVLPETTPPPRLEGPEKLGSRDYRGFTPVTTMGYLTTASLIVPLKFGASIGWNYSPAWTIEAAILTGSLNAGIFGIDVAKYSERSYQVLGRYYGNNESVHMILGLSQETGRFQIGNKYVNYATGAGNIDLAQLQTYAATIGVGQRWQWKNGLTVGVDYLTATVPFQVGDGSSDFFKSTASQSDKDQVRDILNILARMPRAALFTLSAGYSF